MMADTITRTLRLPIHNPPINIYEMMVQGFTHELNAVLDWTDENSPWCDKDEWGRTIVDGQVYISETNRKRYRKETETNTPKTAEGKRQETLAIERWLRRYKNPKKTCRLGHWRDEDNLGIKQSKRLYDTLRETSVLQAKSSGQAIRVAQERLGNYFANRKDGQGKPHFTSFRSIALGPQQWTLYDTDGVRLTGSTGDIVDQWRWDGLMVQLAEEGRLDLSLSTSLLRGMRAVKDTRVCIRIKDPEGYYHGILSQATTMGTARLVRNRHNKWFFHVPVDVPAPKPNGDGTNAGVDVNLKDLTIAVSIPTKKKQLILNEPSVEYRRYREHLRREKLGHQTHTSVGRRSGHGRTKKHEPVTKSRSAEQRWVDTLIRQRMRQVVDFLIEHDVSTVRIEDLSGIRETTSYHKARSNRQKKHNRRMSQWPFFKIQLYLQQAAEMAGIEVVKIEPRFTSKMCSNCHQIHNNSRNGKNFKCRLCGYERHADLNAANNIADPDIEYRVVEALIGQRRRLNRWKDYEFRWVEHGRCELYYQDQGVIATATTWTSLEEAAKKHMHELKRKNSQ